MSQRWLLQTKWPESPGLFWRQEKPIDPVTSLFSLATRRRTIHCLAEINADRVYLHGNTSSVHHLYPRSSGVEAADLPCLLRQSPT
jgi:hypothetical protein